MEKTDKYRFLITKINLSSYGRGNRDLVSSASPRVHAQHPLCAMGWQPGPVTRSLPTSVRTALTWMIQC